MFNVPLPPHLAQAAFAELDSKMFGQRQLIDPLKDDRTTGTSSDALKMALETIKELDSK